MTDIQKMIEVEAIRTTCFENTNELEEYNTNTLRAVDIKTFRRGADFALSKIQHANRWRKVSEELPEWKGEPFTLLTKKIGEYGITYNIFPIHTEKSILFMKDLSDEWKPIE